MIDFPRSPRQNIQNLKSSAVIIVFKNPFLNRTVAVLHNSGCLGVISTYLGVDPGQRFDDGWEGPFHVDKNILCFLQFGDYFVQEILVYSENGNADKFVLFFHCFVFRCEKGDFVAVFVLYCEDLFENKN